MSQPARQPGSPAPPVASPPSRRAPSLSILVIGTVLVPVLLLAVTLVTLSGFTSRRIAEQLGASMLDSAVDRVRADAGGFLDAAVRVSDLYARRLAAGVLPPTGLHAWERTELDDLVTTPDVASICFGTAAGEATWMLRRAGHLELGRVEPGTQHALELVIGLDGVIDPKPFRDYTYDPRARPWYQAAVKENAALWTPVYFWYGDQGSDSETGAGYTRPIAGPDGAVAGVLVIDVTLGGLSSFLSSLPLADSGSIYIVDDQDLLVASSRGAVNTSDGQRMVLEQSSDPAAASVSAAMKRARNTPVTRCTVGGQDAWVRVSTFSPHRGVNWRIVAVVPESAFLAEASSVQRRSLAVAAAVVLIGAVIGLTMARRLASPIMALAAHVRKVGAGDFDARINLREARELADLSTELNRMAGGLHERMELQKALSLATEVQQSLLPRGSPATAGLDIAGTSRYCDSTGGDYYDFIEVADLPGGGVLVAVGDVMGHGIASALLMATARGALRAHAAAGVSLGDLMTKVNAVLAKDARHGRFMTLILVVIDQGAGTLRWASAGHDPPVIFDPAADRFLEVEGGHLPLGIDDTAVYEEHTVPGIPERAVVVLGTDGIWEARNHDSTLFGHERLRGVIRESAGRPSAEILKAIDAALAAFCQTRPAEDDITAVVIRITGENEPPAPESVLDCAGNGQSRT